jgi:prepilin-type N-terminal cleavage/methylation domain-containing protein
MTAVLNKKGLTLVEVMIALVVLLIVSLALMQTALVSIDANMNNSMRDEAVSVAEMRMNEARNLAWASLKTDASTDSDYNPITMPACQDEQECMCKTGEGCPTVGSYDNIFPVEVDRTIRNMTVKFGTRRVVNTLDSANSEVRIIVRAVYKDKCYSQVSSTIVRQPGT